MTAMAISEDYVELRALFVRWVRRLCASRHADQADDIVQQAMLRIVTIKQRDADRVLNASYLWRVAYSSTIDELRRLRAHREDPIIDDLADERSPDPTTARRELAAAIGASIDALSPDRKTVVALYLAGNSVPESARLLGWDAKRVENLVYRGLGDLRESLRARGHGPA